MNKLVKVLKIAGPFLPVTFLVVRECAQLIVDISHDKRITDLEEQMRMAGCGFGIQGKINDDVQRRISKLEDNQEKK